MQNSSTFRYFHLKIAAKRLPGRGLRLDPLAVVFLGAPGAWAELARTERRANEWNPTFSKSIPLPADNEQQRNTQVRVDFYNKEMLESRFLGSCQVCFSALIHAQGRGVELELVTPQKGRGSPRVFLTALEGYQTEMEPTVVHLDFQLMQTNFYGVSMRMFYEISRAGNEQWHPVYTTDNILIDEQGWGQFPTAKINMQDLTMGDETVGLLVALYRYKRIGTKKLLGRFQVTVKDLLRQNAGHLIPFTPNPKEDIISADVQILHANKLGLIYQFSLKLVNVQWNATFLTPQHVK